MDVVQLERKKDGPNDSNFNLLFHFLITSE
jgi:hypothetical protein